jgi:hypothetical protein
MFDIITQVVFPVKSGRGAARAAHRVLVSTSRRRATLTGWGVEATPITHVPFGSIFTVHTPDGALLTMIGAA